jgi:putative ABC transport system substrate-binding protein
LLVLLTSPALSDPFSREVQATARKLGVQLQVLQASTEAEIDTAFAALAQLRAGGLVIGSDVFFNTRSEQLAELALRHAVLTVYQYREFAAAGGLMSYGTNMPDCAIKLPSRISITPPPAVSIARCSKNSPKADGSMPMRI